MLQDILKGEIISMRILGDMHTHSRYSIDGKDSIESMCLSAINKGLKVLSITDHVENNPNDEGFNKFKVDEFILETDELKKKFSKDLILLRGIEFSEPHLYMKELENISTYDLDMIIGSIHWISDESVGQRELLETYPQEEVEKRYYTMVEKTARYGNFDVMGHIDFPKRYYKNSKTSGLYINKILKLLIEKDIALEINTSTYRNGVNESMPSQSIVEKYIDLGGRKLTVGSDSHNSVDIGSDFSKVEHYLSDKYFDYIGTYIKREFVLLSALK